MSVRRATVGGEEALVAPFGNLLKVVLADGRVLFLVPDAEVEDADWDESQHPRGERGRFVGAMTEADHEELRSNSISGRSTDLTDEERDGIEHYTSGGWEDINPQLRALKPVTDPEAQAAVAAIDRLMSFVSLDKEMSVYRVVDSDLYAKFEASMGEEFRDYGYVSTSVNPIPTVSDRQREIDVFLPKGSRAIPVGDVSVFGAGKDGESEILVNRASTFKVERSGSRVVLRLVRS